MSSDPTLNHEAVKAYRDHFKFCPKLGFREDIISTVTDLELWKSVLTSWGYWKDGKWIKFSPLNVKGMLSEYELRTTSAARRANAAAANGVKRISEAQVSETRIPERSDRGVSNVRQGTRIQFRRGSSSLEEILTQALRKNYRA